MSDGPTEQLKKFLFTSKVNTRGEPQEESLEITIPELLQGNYSFYTWPSAPVLAWFLWENRASLLDKRILELGSGTALPGILAAKCGAKVILSDAQSLPKAIAHTKRSCLLNNLKVGEDVRVVGLTWGLFLSDPTALGPIDLILGSDIFYEPSVFEDILVTVGFILEKNHEARFLCSYQERSSDWTIEHLLAKWELECIVHDISGLGSTAGVDLHQIVGDHTVILLEITRKSGM